MSLSLWPPFLCLLRVGVAGLCYQAWLIQCWGSNLVLVCATQVLHPPSHNSSLTHFFLHTSSSLNWDSSSTSVSEFIGWKHSNKAGHKGVSSHFWQGWRNFLQNGQRVQTLGIEQAWFQWPDAGRHGNVTGVNEWM